jgi:hypothetical protein
MDQLHLLYSRLGFFIRQFDKFSYIIGTANKLFPFPKLNAGDESSKGHRDALIKMAATWVLRGMLLNPNGRAALIFDYLLT